MLIPDVTDEQMKTRVYRHEYEFLKTDHSHPQSSDVTTVGNIYQKFILK